MASTRSAAGRPGLSAAACSGRAGRRSTPGGQGRYPRRGRGLPRCARTSYISAGWPGPARDQVLAHPWWRWPRCPGQGEAHRRRAAELAEGTAAEQAGLARHADAEIGQVWAVHRVTRPAMASIQARMWSSSRNGLDHYRYWGRPAHALVRGSPPTRLAAAWTDGGLSARGWPRGRCGPPFGSATQRGVTRSWPALRRWLVDARWPTTGRLVVLTGPPGIGKTRLAEELADSARGNGQRVLWGRAVEERGCAAAVAVAADTGTLSAAPLTKRDRLIGSGSSDSARPLTTLLRPGSARVPQRPTRSPPRQRRRPACCPGGPAMGRPCVAVPQFSERAVAELPGSRLLVLATCRDTAGCSLAASRWPTWPWLPGQQVTCGWRR